MRRLAGFVAAVMVLGPASARADDPWRGWELFRQQCGACHEVGPGARHNQKGPQLNGVLGRPAGGSPGYPFSNALRTADIAWDPANMIQFLANPRDIMPGNRHANVRPTGSVQESEDIIAYLRRFDANGALTNR